MQIFVKSLSGVTRTLNVEQSQNVEELKQRIEELDGIPCDQQRLSCGTITLVDGQSLSVLENESVVCVSLGLEGGKKKRKKKVYTKPKKIAHKNKKVKLAVLKYYKVDPRTLKIQRLKRECTSPECGPGIFMASHYDRQYCGKCHLTYMFKSEEGEKKE